MTKSRKTGNILHKHFQQKKAGAAQLIDVFSKRESGMKDYTKIAD